MKIRVSNDKDNTPRRDHVIAMCNKFDLVFVGINNGNFSSGETKSFCEDA